MGSDNTEEKESIKKQFDSNYVKQKLICIDNVITYQYN